MVGAPSATSGQGAAYVFTQPFSGWTTTNETAKLTASDGLPGDNFGASVSIDGSTVVAGSPNATSSQGAAYVFTEPFSGWTTGTETAELTASDGMPGDRFGDSVSVSGDTVAAGAPHATVGGQVGQGAAYVFTEPFSGWASTNETAKLTASDGEAADNLGALVSISGDTVVAGTAQRLARRPDRPGGGLHLHRTRRRLDQCDRDH